MTWGEAHKGSRAAQQELRAPINRCSQEGVRPSLDAEQTLVRADEDLAVGEGG